MRKNQDSEPVSEVNISVLGDFCPINRVEKSILDQDFSAFEDARNVLSGKDLVIANVECPLTTYKHGINKTGPNLRGNPRSVELLKLLNVNVATLANNHILDFGEQGLSDTIKVLKENNIAPFGAGQSLNEARRPLIKTINGTRICVLNVCEREFSVAGEHTAGANPFDIISLLNDIDTVKTDSDFMILLYHGGIESYNLPTPEMHRNLTFLAGRGVDLIVCNHQHVFSGYQKAGKCHIFYGLGNFIFDWPSIREEPWNYGMILNLVINGDELKRFKLIPYEQCNGIPGVKINGKISERIEKDLEALNLKMTENSISQEWSDFLSRQKDEILSDLFVQNRYIRYILKRSGVLNFLITRQHRRRIYNYLNCISLSELARDSLKVGIS